MKFSEYCSIKGTPKCIQPDEWIKLDNVATTLSLTKFKQVCANIFTQYSARYKLLTDAYTDYLFDFAGMNYHPAKFNDNVSESGSNEIDKSTFVRNLGILLSQTRQNIQCLSYLHVGGGEYARIHFNNGQYLDINITCDSWIAIIQDVMGKIEV